MKVELGPHYLAYVLTSECRNALLATYLSRHEVQVCHHVTIQFNIVKDNLELLQSFIDSKPEFELSNFFQTDTIDFFTVNVNGNVMMTDQSYSHLTFSRKPEARNRDSNAVLKGEIAYSQILKASGKLQGTFELVKY